jgi:uncharacterized protein YdeI (YjbR/CyaY-like superfamily)
MIHARNLIHQRRRAKIFPFSTRQKVSNKKTSPMKPIPEDLRAALKASGLDDFFAGCTVAHQGEYLKWIVEAKQPETRKKRIAQAVKMISAKSAQEAARLKKHA